MKPSEVLDAAADLIERRGFIKGEFHSKAGFCTLGALNHVAGRGDPAHLETAKQLLWTRHRHISRWNDNPDTTADEVIETLHKVAAEARWTE